MISSNIAEMVSSGHSSDQAAAASYRKAREAAKKIGDRHRREAVLRRLSKKS